MARNSQQEADAVDWAVAPLPLGAAGLDLRTPTSPGALTKLLNARFRDESTLDRRNGYSATRVQDAGNFASTNVPTGWLYGHGQLLAGANRLEHHPVARQGRGTFRLDSADYAWTGDRLIIPRSEQPGIGESAFWGRGSGNKSWGIPAYLPTQTEANTPDVITGNSVETCLTQTLRVVIASTSANDLIAWVSDRVTGAVLNKTVVATANGGLNEPRIVSSGGLPVVVWLDGTTLYLSWWSGTQWSSPSVMRDDVTTFELAEVTGGFLVAWLTGGTISVGRYLGYHTDSTVFTFGTALSLGGSSAAGAMAVTVAPNGSIGLVWQSASGLTLYASTFASNLTGGTHLQIDATAGPYDSGVAACFRGIITATGYNLVVHAGNGGLYTRIWEIQAGAVLQVTTRYRTKLSSKSFRVGDEVLCWLFARNSETNYLLAGVTNAQMCGICDREEAISRSVRDTGAPGYGVKNLPMVYPDPLDPHAFTWARTFETTRVVVIDDKAEKYSDLYNRAGNARVSNMQFLPTLSAVQFGESVYIAGSLVRNWDGLELGDAGFQDYPLLPSSYVTSDGAGELSSSTVGAYYFRVYAVRYNKRGERFQSAALTSLPISLTTSGHDTITLSIYTIPATNHSDVTFEVYRTEAGGTTFYLEGTVANSLTADTVSYVSTVSDAALRTRQGDSHAPGIGFISELEEMGPIGCEFLMAAGDRLWGAGGQLPTGTVQFSKLKEPGEGAGFDPLSGTQQIDVQGAPITSMATFGDGKVFFQETGFQVIANDGPDNYGQGGFGVPELVLADGAVTHLGTVTIPVGVLYWGADGPRLMTANFQTEQICAPVRELSKTMTPSGIQVDIARQEAVWVTEEGDALLWNFRAVESKFGQLTSMGRWAQWRMPGIAAASQRAFLTTDGLLLNEDADAYGDGGVPFTYGGATSYLAPQSILGGSTHVRGVGVAGEFLGDHSLRLKVFYDGSPMWTDKWEWAPQQDTGLQTGNDLAGLNAAAIDALNLADRSGQYATHKRVSHHRCRHFRVEWSDISSQRPTYRLHELTLELGGIGGFGRVPVGTFNGPA